MNGFITESVSKIYDGFGTAAYLLMITFAARLVYLPVEKALGKTGIFVYILVLLAVGTFLAGKSLTKAKDDNHLAFYGMSAGVLLWQAVQFSLKFGSDNSIGWSGWLIGGAVLALMILLWKKILPFGLRFFAAEFTLLWAGVLYRDGLAQLGHWSPAIAAGYQLLRAAALVGILFIIWWIAFRTKEVAQRQACGMALAFCAMLAGLWF